MFETSKLLTLGKEITVLYVEDDELLISSTKSFLEKFFSVVDVAKDGKTALALYKEHRHKLIITDIKMPNMNGLELVRHIRDIDKSQKIIAISAYNFAEIAESGAHRKVDKFLQKPVAYDDFIRTLEEICEDILHLNTSETVEIKIDELLELKLRVENLEKRVEDLESTKV